MENTKLPMAMARVGVWFDRLEAERRRQQGHNTFQLYIGEILNHAGIPFHWIDTAEQCRRADWDVLVVALAPDNIRSAETIEAFAEQGGSAIALANLASMADRLGCEPGQTIGKGYALLPASLGDTRPLRFLEAAPWAIADAQSPANPMALGELRRDTPAGQPVGAALLQFPVGRGIIARWAVDIAATVVALQQGLEPVLHDGLPAPDGSAAIDEGILKADDGFTLDWEWDRVKTATGQPYFAHPYADLWREAFIGHLLRSALQLGLTLPFVDYWPDGITAMGMISHDSDLNQDATAETTLGILKELGIHSTWCMLEPGYSPAIYERVKADGHELAFHYNAVVHENYKWDAGDFKRQFAWMKQATGLKSVTSNKNHYTRFEGWGDLFRWLEDASIAVDQTRGASKRGNVGLLFGTCHPFFPIAWHDESNRLYDVLEIGFLTQDMDLGAWADTSVITPFLDQVQRVRGVAHFLFHPVHLHNQEPVRNAFRTVIGQARRRGFTFWTCQQINAWERARRTLRIEGLDPQGGVRVQHALSASALPFNEMVVWAPVADPGEDADSESALERRFGVWCEKQLVRLG